MNMSLNKKRLFLTYGAAGGAVGSLLAELLPLAHKSSSKMELAVGTAIWSAVLAASITVGLFAAGEKHLRRPFSGGVYYRAIVSGLLAGGFAGFVAQAVYGQFSTPSLFRDLVIRSCCWGLMGGILGARLSSTVPNLGFGRGCLAGGLGGLIGGFCFLITCEILPEAMGRFVGVGILGGALGLAVVWVEEAFRMASLEVIWGPGEKTEVTLGSSPVYVGGGDDTVYVRGLQRRALSIVLEEGRILCTNHTNGTENQLKDGSRIRVGSVELAVHAIASVKS
jgi:hypothetical protein